MEPFTLDKQAITKREPSTLDEQITTLNEWIKKAGISLMSFYKDGCFGRHTLEMLDVLEKLEDDPNTSVPMHPTCTHRSFFAMYEYLRFLYEEDLLDEMKGVNINNVTDILQWVTKSYLMMLVVKDSSEESVVRKSQLVGKANMFTDGHLLISISLLESLQKGLQSLQEDKVIRNVDISDQDILDLKNVAQKIADERKADLLKKEPGQKIGGKVGKGGAHDFLTLFVLRGIEAFNENQKLPPATDNLNELQNQVQEDILQFLGFNTAGVSSRFDATELTFNLVVLNRLSPNASQLTECALRIIKEKQEHDGGWPTLRQLSYADQLGIVLIPSYEVALALTDLLLRRLYDNNLHLCEEVFLPVLNKAFELVKSHYNYEGVGVGGKKVTGWANDHIHQPKLVESWSTAIVLTFLIHYRDALYHIRQYSVLRQYDAQYLDSSKSIYGSYAWPDMILALRQPDIKSSLLDDVADPTGGRIIKSLRDTIVQPINKSWIHRPGEDRGSLIFYGPPGTRKTTLSQQIAKTLQWPLITLSPPYFLQNHGLEGMEVCAAEIFENLLHLRRVVVLFDECEEFFKARPKDQRLESRTIGAFITAGMLPRLDKLHKQQWVVFILATNSELKDLDEAVIRPRRFDYAQRIGHPTLDAQKKYIRKTKLFSNNTNVVEKVLEDYNNQLIVGIPDATPISFAILDTLDKETKEQRDPKDIWDTLKQLLKQKGPRSLI